MNRFSIFLIAAFFSNLACSQTVFWSENFNNGCTSLCLAGSYSGANGAWSVVNNGPASACGAPTTPNEWYISCAENGNAVGTCGTGCGNNATLHVGNIPSSPSAPVFCPTGDCGAAYDAGGYCVLLASPPSTQTDKRAESPVINCTGFSNITIGFKYLENGQGTNDDATLWYFDGTAWNQINGIAKSNNAGCGGQGRWTAFSMVLPASANNNPNVKIGFRWVNDDDGSGNDPSFAVDDVTLSVPGGAPPVASFSVSAATICAGQCVNFTDLSTNSPTSWSWSFTGAAPASSTQQNPSNICYSTAGTYTASLTATNANGSSTTSQVITVNPLPVANAGSDVTICPGATATLSATGGGSYLWNTGQTTSVITVNPTTTTAYSVTVTNSCGSASDSVSVVVSNNITASVTGNTTVCSGQSTTLTASGGSNYSWSNGATASSITVSAAGNYSVIVSSGGCADTAFASVMVNPNPSASAASNVTIAPGQSATLTAAGGVNYVWNPGGTGQTISVTPTVTTFYCVTVTDANNCSDTACVTVTVELMDCTNTGELFLPNAFSPNDDSDNDAFRIYYGNTSCIKILQLSVYNRWGEIIFESDDPAFQWDGTHRGKKLDSGVYTYHMKVHLNNNSVIDRKGNITILR